MSSVYFESHTHIYVYIYIYIISPEGYEVAIYDNQLPPSTPGQLLGTSKGVCVYLNIIAPSIPMTDKSICILLQFQQKNPIIEYIRKM